MVDLRVYRNLEHFFAENPNPDLWLATTKAPQDYTGATFRDNCYLFFGKETAGLPEEFRLAHYCLLYTSYHALFPAVAEDEETGEPVDVDADDEEYGLVIMKVVEENGEELLSTLDNDEEVETVYNLFMERFFEEEEEN